MIQPTNKINFEHETNVMWKFSHYMGHAGTLGKITIILGILLSQRKRKRERKIV